MFGILITHERSDRTGVAVWLKRPYWPEAGCAGYALAGAIIGSRFTIYGP